MPGSAHQSFYVPEGMEPTVRSLLAEVPDLPDHETQRLLLLAVGEEYSWLLGNPPVPQQAVDRFFRSVERRRSGEPLQHIEGTVQFGPLALASDRRALVPRPETERLWEIAIGFISNIGAPVIVDLCTGSGNLALACKHQCPSALVIGTDISRTALSLAIENRGVTGLDVEFLEGDLFAALPQELRGNVDLIVSNPPYVASSEFADLPVEVRDSEPRRALVAGTRGTEILARIAKGAVDWLGPDGVVACEIGETQGDLCLDLFAQYGPRVEEDLAGRPRYILGRAPQRPNVH